MPKEFGIAFVDGLFLAVSIKTGVDASEAGIALSFLNALKQGTQSSFPFDFAIFMITIGATIAMILSFIKSPFVTGLGFILGFIAGMV